MDFWVLDSFARTTPVGGSPQARIRNEDRLDGINMTGPSSSVSGQTHSQVATSSSKTSASAATATSAKMSQASASQQFTPRTVNKPGSAGPTTQSPSVSQPPQNQTKSIGAPSSTSTGRTSPVKPGPNPAPEARAPARAGESTGFNRTNFHTSEYRQDGSSAGGKSASMNRPASLSSERRAMQEQAAPLPSSGHQSTSTPKWTPLPARYSTSERPQAEATTNTPAARPHPVHSSPSSASTDRRTSSASVRPPITSPSSAGPSTSRTTSTPAIRPSPAVLSSAGPSTMTSTPPVCPPPSAPSPAGPSSATATGSRFTRPPRPAASSSARPSTGKMTSTAITRPPPASSSAGPSTARTTSTPAVRPSPSASSTMPSTPSVRPLPSAPSPAGSNARTTATPSVLPPPAASTSAGSSTDTTTKQLSVRPPEASSSAGPSTTTSAPAIGVSAAVLPSGESSADKSPDGPAVPHPTGSSSVACPSEISIDDENSSMDSSLPQAEKLKVRKRARPHRKLQDKVLEEMVPVATEPLEMLQEVLTRWRYDDLFSDLLPKTIRSMEQKVEVIQDPSDEEHEFFVAAIDYARQWYNTFPLHRPKVPANQSIGQEAQSDESETTSVTHDMRIGEQGSIAAGPSSATKNASAATASPSKTPVVFGNPISTSTSVPYDAQGREIGPPRVPQDRTCAIPQSHSPFSPIVGTSSMAASAKIDIDDENSSIGSPLPNTKKRKRSPRKSLNDVLAEMVLETAKSWEMLTSNVMKPESDKLFLDLLPKTIGRMERRAKEIQDPYDEEHEELADALDYARNWYTLLLNRRSPKDPAKGSTGQMADSDTVETSSGTHDMLSSKQSSSMAGPDSAIEKVGAATTFASPSGPISDIPAPTSAAPATTLIPGASTVSGARADKYTAVLRNSRDDTAGISNAIRTGMQQALDESLRFRAAVIDPLSASLKSAVAEIQTLEEELAAGAQQRANLMTEVQKLKSEIQSQREEQAESQTKMSQLEKDIEAQKQKVTEGKASLDQLKDSHRSATKSTLTRIDVLDKTKTILEGRLRELGIVMKQAGTALEETRAREEDLKKKLALADTQHQAKLTEYEAKVATQSSQIATLETDAARHAKMTEGHGQEVAALRATLTEEHNKKVEELAVERARALGDLERGLSTNHESALKSAAEKTRAETVRAAGLRSELAELEKTLADHEKKSASKLFDAEFSANQRALKTVIDQRGTKIQRLNNSVIEADRRAGAAEKTLQDTRKEVDRLKKEAEAVKADSTSTQEALQESRKEVDRLKQEAAAVKADSTSTQEALQESRKEVDRLKQEAEAVKADSTSTQEALQDSRKEGDRLKQEVEAVKAGSTSTQEALTAARTRLADMESRANELGIELSEVKKANSEKEADLVRKTEAIRNVANRYSEAENAISALETERTELQQKVANLEQSRAEEQTKLEDSTKAAEEVSELKRSLADSESHVQRATERISLMAKHQTDAMNALSNLETEKEELQQQVAALEESHAGDRTKLEGDLQSAKREIEVLKQALQKAQSVAPTATVPRTRDAHTPVRNDRRLESAHGSIPRSHGAEASSSISNLKAETSLETVATPEAHPNMASPASERASNAGLGRDRNLETPIARPSRIIELSHEDMNTPGTSSSSGTPSSDYQVKEGSGRKRSLASSSRQGSPTNDRKKIKKEPRPFVVVTPAMAATYARERWHEFAQRPKHGDGVVCKLCFLEYKNKPNFPKDAKLEDQSPLPGLKYDQTDKFVEHLYSHQKHLAKVIRTRQRPKEE